MKTIVFVSEKGGVGKTRLADELYYFYQRTGVPVSLYSFDGQYKNRTADKSPIIRMWLWWIHRGN